jgi:hypothetical protein
MKATSPLFTVVLAAFTLAALYEGATLTVGAHSVQAAKTGQTPASAPAAGQTPPPAGPAAAEPHQHTHAAPTNLKVLPKTLTGEEVHEIMEQWEAALGAHCNTCHTADPNNIGPNGRPRLNYADDSKPEKQTARLMFTMTEEINKGYIAKFDNSGDAVTCGTCHRGHLGPEPFVAPPEKHNAPPVPQPAPAK